MQKSNMTIHGNLNSIFVRDGLALLDANLSEQVHIAPIMRDIHAMLWFAARQLPLQDVPHLVAKGHVPPSAIQCGSCRAEDLQNGFMQKGMIGRGNQDSLVDVAPRGTDARNQLAAGSFTQDVREVDEKRRLDVEVTSSNEEQQEITKKVRSVCRHTHGSIMLQYNSAQQTLDEAFAFFIDPEFAVEAHGHHALHVHLCFPVLWAARMPPNPETTPKKTENKRIHNEKKQKKRYTEPTIPEKREAKPTNP